MGRADVEQDMVRATEALQAALDFLIRYDHAHAVLNGNGRAGPLSPLTLHTDDGLRAAHRVLTHLREVNGRPAPAAAARRDVPAPRSPGPALGEPVQPGWGAHGDPGE
ncbi:hypothetical protein SAMN05444365_11343 [Micromonospora pattaloongensis]|uniref:Uncharacterized protein n=1 Tax=Micromonospora pattaloongensis TaxID=405436 RepID=A0A1H3SQ73_9ACTN|nr:hypothetical protein [Micromonospora pattaloongensis]SDZ40074.1 hypothetical protein SAMN05444365_11343 [Micromonospora pattaloongensis]